MPMITRFCFLLFFYSFDVEISLLRFRSLRFPFLSRVSGEDMLRLLGRGTGSSCSSEGLLATIRATLPLDMICLDTSHV